MRKRGHSARGSRGGDAARRDSELRQKTNQSTKGRIRMARGITVDSGAADNVLPRRILRKWMKMRQSEASRLGVHYVAANGARIPNEGVGSRTKMGKRIRGFSKSPR